MDREKRYGILFIISTLVMAGGMVICTFVPEQEGYIFPVHLWGALLAAIGGAGLGMVAQEFL